MAEGEEFTESRNLNSEDFRVMVAELFAAKLRASFNSSIPEMINRFMTREALFEEMLLPKSENKYTEIVGKKMADWRVSDFSLRYTPIGDYVFECMNNKMLDARGEITHSRLKEIVIEAEEGDSCRTCLENRHVLTEEDLVRKFDHGFRRVNCALNPNGLGIKIEANVVVDAFGKTSIRIGNDGFSISDSIKRELRWHRIPWREMIPLSEADSQEIVLRFSQLTEASTNEVREIWVSKGYRENLVLRGHENIKKRAPRNRVIREDVSNHAVANGLLSLLKQIEESWNPTGFTDPRYFLQSGIEMGLQDGKWPVQFLEMNEKTCNFIESGLERKLKTPILIDNRQHEVGKITIHLDNIELWR